MGLVRWLGGYSFHLAAFETVITTTIKGKGGGSIDVAYFYISMVKTDTPERHI